MEKMKENYGVSVITCTNKTIFMKNIFNNYLSQRLENKELIIILNNNKLSLNEWEVEARKFKNVSVYQFSEKISLGRCLNFAIKKSKYNYIAKLDDDDYYAPAYLSDSLHAIESTNADVVGKKTHFMYMPDNKLLFIRYPYQENRFVKYLMGGTILAKRSVFDRVKFRDVSIREDTGFYEDCLAKGFKIYATNRFFYTYMRRNDSRDHTWKTNEEHLLNNCIVEAKTNNYRRYADLRTSNSKTIHTSSGKDLSFDIPKEIVRGAFERCKNKRTFGIDSQTIQDFELNGFKQLDKLWKQLSSGYYFPSPVQRAYKRKPTGGLRPVGVPTVRDHLVQTILRDQLYSKFKTRWHPNSFLHCKKAKIAAVETAQERCLLYDWALILDIKEYGDNIDQKTLMSMLRKHFDTQWVLLYIDRMLKVPVRMKDGTIEFRPDKGIPHDDSLSPFLADFYMHDIFDEWMKENHPNISFERYIDDIIIHCSSKAQAKALLSGITERFKSYNLKKNKKKTKIVYCKDDNRKGNYKNVSFEFLENTFRSHTIKLRSGKQIAIFGPKSR